MFVHQFSMFASGSLLFAVFVVFILPHGIIATNSSYNCSSSCGSILIKYPFRLKTDPKSCGHKDWELSCENRLLELYLSSIKYYVQAINYNNSTIRLVDAEMQKDNCSSIPHPVDLFTAETFFYPFTYSDVRYGNIRLIFVKCANPVNSPFYVDTSACNDNGLNSQPYNNSNGAVYSYVMAGPTDYASDLADSCLIELIYPSCLTPEDVTNNSLSYMDVHNSMAYGFQLSWFGACCDIPQPHMCGLEDRYVYCGYSESRWSLVVYQIEEFAWIIRDMFSRVFEAVPILKPFEQFIVGGSLDDKDKGLHVYLIALVRYFFILHHVLWWSCGAPCVIIFLIYKWRRRHLSMYYSIEEFLQSHQDLMPIRYSYSDLKKITKRFKEKLGEGGFGFVYKGKLRSDRLVAVKMLGKSKANANGQEFINEVATIGRIHHKNVVQLIGYCVEGLKHALVYEFMPNGSLDKHIFSREGSVQINIEKMYEISLGIACGIEYLHRGCYMRILHFDIKPHNILLDEKLNPKISDFGLAKLHSTDNTIVSLTAARGTIGYMAPELFYKTLGGVSYKADVYSYGMLLMEMAGRRRNLNALTENSDNIYFPTFVYDQYSKGNDIEMEYATEEERKITKKMLIVALWCIQLKPNDRPPMHKVIEMLEGEVETLQMPPKLSLWPQREANNSTGSTNLPLSEHSMSSISLVIDADYTINKSLQSS